MAGEEQTDSSGKYGMGGGGGRDEHESPRWWPIILKVLELLLAIVCIGLIDDPANNSRTRVFLSQRTVALSYVTFGTFLIFSAVYIIGKIVRDHWPWKTSALLSLIGAGLYLAATTMILRDWATTKERNYWPPNTQRLDLQCACGFLALGACVVYLIDLGLTVRAGIRGKMD